MWRKAGTRWTFSVAPTHGSVTNKPGAKWPRSTWSAFTARGRHRRPRGLQSFLVTGRNCASVGPALAVIAWHTILDPFVLVATHGTCQRGLYRAGTAQATVFRWNTPWDVVRRA